MTLLPGLFGKPGHLFTAYLTQELDHGSPHSLQDGEHLGRQKATTCTHTHTH